MSTAAPADIERIVREVMSQLKLAAEPRRAAAPVSPAAAPLAVSPSHGELFVDARVVTLESIAGRLKTAKRLLVAPGALVTPSVRDELRRRGIALVQESAANKTKPAAAPVLLVIGRTGHSPDMAMQMLQQEGIDARSESTDCLIEAAGKLAAAVAAGSLGLMWTRHTAIGLCLANRRKEIRAVLAAGVKATAAAVAAVGANVLVIDPSIGTMYEKNQVVRDFCLGGICDCPEALKKGLST